MKGEVVVVCGIVAVFGIISAVAGFAAEATKVKVPEVRIVGYSCVYPSSPALGLGILAAVCAIITRIIILTVIGCCNCCPRGSTSSPTSCLFNILSWIASIVAAILLLAGAALNSREGGQKDYDGTITCYVARPGIFAAGAVLSLLNAFFGIVAYVSLSPANYISLSSALATRTTSKIEFAFPVAGNLDLEKSQLQPQED